MSNAENLTNLIAYSTAVARPLAIIKTLNFSVVPAQVSPAELQAQGISSWGYFVPFDVPARELLSDVSVISSQYSLGDYLYHYKYVGGFFKFGRTWKPHTQSTWNSLLAHGPALSRLCNLCVVPGKEKEKVLAIEALLNTLNGSGEDSIECVAILSRALIQVIACLRGSKKVQVVPSDSNQPLDVFMCKILERAFGE